MKALTECDLAEVCKLRGLTEAYLLRIFHREVGKTFQQYPGKRMSRAVEMPRTDTRPIKQVALEYGYTNVSAFYRDIKTVRLIFNRRRIHTRLDSDNKQHTLTIVFPADLTDAFPTHCFLHAADAAVRLVVGGGSRSLVDCRVV
jgi:hypothetical protein